LPAPVSCLPIAASPDMGRVDARAGPRPDATVRARD
jgi:hypothetical protein